jgi:hypothetical protein
MKVPQISCVPYKNVAGIENPMTLKDFTLWFRECKKDERGYRYTKDNKDYEYTKNGLIRPKRTFE